MMDQALGLVLWIFRRLARLRHGIHQQLILADLRRRGCEIGRDVRLGLRTRFHVARGSRLRLGDGVSIGDDCWIITHEGDEMVLGENVYLSIRCTVSGNVTIGPGTMLAADVFVLDSDHGHGDLDTPMREQAPLRSPVTIGEDVWLGRGATVLRGTNLGGHSIVGAGVVVRGRLDPYSALLPGRPLLRSRRMPDKE